MQFLSTIYLNAVLKMNIEKNLFLMFFLFYYFKNDCTDINRFPCIQEVVLMTSEISSPNSNRSLHKDYFLNT